MTQEQALSILKSGQSVFITGEPGAGKTYTVNAYVRYLREHDIAPAITASTGIAATHIHGMTIHSWSGIGIKRELTKDDLEKLAHNKYIKRRLVKATVLIIDEVSMLAARTLDMVDAVCRKMRDIPYAFGGLQVVLVGDFFQLPPISREGEDPAEFAFASQAWRELGPTVCYLTEQHRQDDTEFLAVLSAIRSGEYTNAHRAQLQSRVGHGHGSAQKLPQLFPHNANVDTINTHELNKISSHAKEFVMLGSGKEHFVETLKRGCLSPERLVLKVGASVMCTKNNPDAGFINGTLGMVTRFSKDNGYPVIKTRESGELLIEPMEWIIEEDDNVKARISQVPLRLAWAMTIHKSQGMSMDAAVIDLTGAFEFGQGYVALSRVRRLAGLYLLGFNERALQVHPTVLSRDAEFHERSAAVEASLEYGSAKERAHSEKDFIVACGGKWENTVMRDEMDGVSRGANRKSGTRGGEWLAKKRTVHANAYRPWNPEDDALLTTMFEANVTTVHIANFFKRDTGAILSRLKKLGLLID